MEAMEQETLAAILTISSFGLLFYAYGAYPIFLWLLGCLLRSEGSERSEPKQWPKVSIILSAYNEERIIAERIKNLLKLDYPLDLIEILIGSDGCTDRTCEIVDSFARRGIRLIAFTERRGKASVLNDLLSAARGEVVVLTDANTFFDPEAVRELVRALWRSPSAHAVVGRLELRSSAGSGNLDGLYWRYETWIKILESRLGAVLGANGAIYAFRREKYQPLPKEAIVDDFLIPMLMRLRSGGKIFFIPSAKAWETSPERVGDEFRRRVRIGAGDFQALLWTWRLLLPWKGMIALSYLSHKVLRWFGPWLLLLGFGANLWLLGHPFFQLLFFGQISLYVLGLCAALFRRVPILGAAASGARYFLVLNAGLFLGFGRFTLGIARPFWSTARAEGEAVQSAELPLGFPSQSILESGPAETSGDAA
ncbi:MAG: glycosyltransferase family 2 protein [Deltaproteobacteria bacterium]|nr:glycosyltransferase family 2 protein [Deltaproteobacteria bacterium]